MKRIIFLLTAIFMVTSAALADNDKPITVEQLPAAAKQIIADYFPNAKVSFAKMETDIFEKSYEVIFTDGNKLEFNSKGEWTEVNCKFTQVPEGIVPQQIRNYISSNYNEVKIVEIERDRRDYEVKLGNGMELTFDLKFNLIDIDN